MPVLNISTATIKDRAAFEVYVDQASALMDEFGVEVVARGTFIETHEGEEMPAHVGAIFRYPSLDVARAFFASPDYQALIALRERACDMVIRFYEEPNSL